MDARRLRRFEARARAELWGLAGRAATVESLDADQLALARIVVTIDTAPALVIVRIED